VSLPLPDITFSSRARRVPPLGGFNLSFLGLEMRRLVRNRQTVAISLVVPVIFFFILSKSQSDGANIQASVMIGIAVYGGMTAATAGGAMVSVERALGWSRQLRLTPLRPPAYIAIKLLTAMFLGLLSVSAIFVSGAVSGVQMPLGVWILSALLAWGGALVFASFGLFMGYLLPSENVMQVIGPVLGAFAFAGGLFLPLSLMPSVVQTLAPYTPTYGVAQIARSPLVGGGIDPAWLVNVVVWTAVFAGCAMLLFRRDTKRS
jgi:ABC-2 type transport system permease protein